MDYLPIIQTTLASLGINVAGNAIYDFIKSCFQNKPKVDKQELEKMMQSFLEVHNTTVSAMTVINAFAEKGILLIQGSDLYAPDEITIGAGPGANFTFGNNSTSKTDKSRIVAGTGAGIKGGNASVVQGHDGSIRFYVGKKK